MVKKYIQEIKKIYSEKKEEIQERIKDFETLWEKGTQEDIFAELVFCLLTPQSKALICWNAVENIVRKGLLTRGEKLEVANELKGVRFKNKKAGYIIEARNLFSMLKKKLDELNDLNEKREYLVKNIKGYGYKEASHFLRNVGFCEKIAILDRHILKNLFFAGVINKIPKSLSRKKYLEIEKKMALFSKNINIPLSHLDLLFWSKESGKIFK